MTRRQRVVSQNMRLTELIVARWQAGDDTALILLANYEDALTLHREARSLPERELAKLAVENCELAMRRMIDG